MRACGWSRKPKAERRGPGRAVCVLLACCALLAVPDVFRGAELLFLLPRTGETNRVYISRPQADGDVRVFWLTNGADGLVLQRWIADRDEWFACSSLATYQQGPWRVYVGAPAFGEGRFRLVRVAE
jgi:hypothetical protein